MNIKEAFEKAKNENRLAVVPYFTAGYPTVESSYEVFLSMAKAGADVIEVGIPFSDPLAEGPVIQYSSSEALLKGASTDKIFDMVKKLSGKVETPLLIMTYYNILYGYGLAKFCNKAVRCGVKGVIIPDLIPEEAGEWLNISKDKLDTVFLTAPTSNNQRLKRITKISQGFVYCVSLIGITGSKRELDMSFKDYVSNVKKHSSLPVAIGFGISKASQAKKIKGLADGVIIGSAFIKIYKEAQNHKTAIEKISKLIRTIKAV